LISSYVLPDPSNRERTVGEMLALLAGTDAAPGAAAPGDATKGQETGT